MADLQQVVGAILRDLAKARFGTDLYSRSIARYYENDYLLRKFPVPRADVEEVEIDLKFSVAEIQGSDVNTEGREANVAVLLERTVEKLVATFLDLSRAQVDGDADGLGADLKATMTKGFGSAALRIELRQKGLRYFIESYTHLIDPDGGFDADLALKELRRPFRWGLEEYRSEDADPDRMGKALDQIIDDVFQRKEFVDTVRSLADPIKSIWQSNYDARLDVEVQGDRLAQFSEKAISSVKIKAVVRNLVWTEVKVDERKYRHTLTSD